MIKEKLPNQLLMDWFTKSLFPSISKDVTMVGMAYKEQYMLHDNNLDHFNSYYNTLYNIFPHAPRSLTDPLRPKSGPHVDGMDVYVSSASVG
jgi:hypothetical protein